MTASSLLLVYGTVTIFFSFFQVHLALIDAGIAYLILGIGIAVAQ